MKELSLHIMDIIENGISAGADLINLFIEESGKENRLRITITDNGSGIPNDMIDKVMDPFYTTRSTRSVGLGLSLFRDASKRCEGDFQLTSEEGRGTQVEASFQLDHIDLAPLGDIAGSLGSLIMGNPNVDFYYRHEIDEKSYQLDTREIRGELDGVSMNNVKVVRYIMDNIRESLGEIKK